ncbi:MAG: DUF4867 family protein, partial [Erysipelotrichaceae bacterium]|nr:DUF4867 family protein [Erysipelotrichaceae bacterium]
EELNIRNDVEIISIRDERCRSFGRIIEGIDVSDLVSHMENDTSIPEEGNIYVASVKEMEALPSASVIAKVIYGDMPIQIGYCNGRNTTYNGFEYHKGSEVNVAVTDFMLVLGHSYDISEELNYSVEQASVFYIEKGTVYEIYETTLHLSPLRVSDEGFRNVIILPRGTNTPLSDDEKRMRDEAYRKGNREARLLLQRNKWVIAHPDREPLISQGAHPGLAGPNKELYY